MKRNPPPLQSSHTERSLLFYSQCDARFMLSAFFAISAMYRSTSSPFSFRVACSFLVNMLSSIVRVKISSWSSCKNQHNFSNGEVLEIMKLNMLTCMCLFFALTSSSRSFVLRSSLFRSVLTLSNCSCFCCRVEISSDRVLIRD